MCIVGILILMETMSWFMYALSGILRTPSRNHIVGPLVIFVSFICNRSPTSLKLATTLGQEEIYLSKSLFTQTKFFQLLGLTTRVN